VLSELMPGLPQLDVRSMRALAEAGLRNTRLAAALLVWFSLLGTVVAALGVYAASALLAAARAREIGIRIALGAPAADIRWIVVSRTVRLVAVALPAGFLAAWALARQLSHLLFLVTPADAATYAISSVVLLAAALLASLRPALRAGATDPVIALRSE
jgi:ABC-type antimicrobial peptide transport system permease subunit